MLRPVAAVLVAVLAVGTATPAAAQVLPPPAVPVAAVPEAPDCATDHFADPWDYGNAEDVHTWTPAVQGGSALLADGRLHFSSPAGGHVHLIFPSFVDTALGVRDGDRVPLDPTTYRTVAMRVRSSAHLTAAVVTDTCPGVAQHCDTYHDVTLEEGWGTYLVPLPPSGPVHGLRLAVSRGPVDLQVDWVRVVAGDVGRVPVGGLGPVFWDADDTTANNTPEQPGWGRVPAEGFPAAAYPPGAYRFYSALGDGGAGDPTRSAASAPLHVLARPSVAVLDPDRAGGEDHITALTGDPWDFSQPTDAVVGNARDVTVADGVLSATNTSNDPYVDLRLGPTPIDPTRYHRLSVTFRLDGPFDLSFDPGGGAHGRVIWAHQPYVFTDSNELVAYPNEPTHVLDLADPAVQEEASQPAWTAAPVIQLRFDPNEDPGPRRWHVDEVRLAADDETSAGGFDVTFLDRALDVPAPDGTTTTFEVLARTDGGEPRTVATGTVTDERTVARWDTCGVPPGRYEISVRAVRRGGGVEATTTAEATGPLVVRPEDSTCAAEEPSPPPGGVAEPDGMRLAGASRVETAAAVARAAFPAGADHAVVVTADAFADALAAAPLAAALEGPVLLTGRAALPTVTTAVLDELGVRRVTVLGGHAAVAPAVEAELARGGRAVSRVAGPDRFATAAAVAARLAEHAAPAEAVLAAGGTFPDALTGGWRAAALGTPLLLTGGDALPPATADALRALAIQRVVLVGGTAVITDAVADAVRALGIDVQRIAGPDRFATGAAVVGATLPHLDAVDGVLVASGEAFPDALTAGPAAAVTDRVLVLTARDTVPEPTRRLLDQLAPRHLQVAGGEAAVATGTLTQLAALVR